MLRREGWLVNMKHVRRLYRLGGLQLRMRRCTRRMLIVIDHFSRQSRLIESQFASAVATLSRPYST
jgi:hypothetical protein